jgi:hypothetical protein
MAYILKKNNFRFLAKSSDMGAHIVIGLRLNCCQLGWGLFAIYPHAIHADSPVCLGGGRRRRKIKKNKRSF